MASDIGSYFILRIEETELSNETRAILKEIRPIGIHFGADAFHQNASYTEWLKAYQSLRKDIQNCIQRDKIFWALDHEGGRVHRVPPPITHLPYPLNWEEHTRAVGEIFAKELHSLGINLLFGPSVDIYSNEENQVIGPRAFGRTAEEVISRVTPFLKALHDGQIAPVIKHFPGHGDTVEDSHFELPTLQMNLKELSEREIVPFKHFSSDSHIAMMLAHIMFPKVDKALPASLSGEFTNTLLREELGYEGLILTDDLNMHAIADNFSAEEIANAMQSAKIDIAIFNHDLNKALDAYKALSTQKIDQNDASKHSERIEQLLSFVHHNSPYELGAEELNKHEKLSAGINESFSPNVKDFIGA